MDNLNTTDNFEERYQKGSLPLFLLLIPIIYEVLPILSAEHVIKGNGTSAA
jgi:hypothetical protein